MPYIYISKIKIQIYLTYRFEFFSSIITRMIIILANIFLWNCVYFSRDLIIDVGRQQMITYSFLSACLSLMFQCEVQNTINKDVREGMIAVSLLRPYNLFMAYLFEDVGIIIARIVTIVIPIFIFGMIFFRILAPISVLHILLIVISIINGFLILWLLSALIGMFAFFTLELGNMGVVKDAIVSFLSGSMIPIWFFPSKIEKVLMLTPFPYTYQLPLGLYIGKIDISEGVHQIFIQVMWELITVFAVYYIWTKAKGKVLVQGG